MKLARVRVNGGAPVLASEHGGELRRLTADGAYDPDGERLDGERVAPVAPGTVVECEIDGIGTLRNPVIAG
jgi:2-keto-4-pentenoate hydratase/2-oxohepta-3-ene-1,7-dioic acid hydratase in catechol pathway